VPNKRLLVLLSILIVLLGIYAVVLFPPEYFSALGSLFAAVGGILAVIWFSSSLYYQSQQLKEQRQQFLEEFRQLREEARRNALVLAKDILLQAEEKALKQNPALKSINDLMALYIDLSEWRTILKSEDPAMVLEYGKTWITMKEGPAIFLMRGIKSAAETYFRAIGYCDVDYSKEPEDFIFIYGPTLWKLPYFEAYQAVATWLSEFMVRMQPSRKAIQLAYYVALLKSTPEIMKKDKIVEDISQHKKAGYPLPAIAKDL
jgi:hypothetical protein